MTDDSFARLIYLVLLGCVVGGYFFASSRENLSQTARHAALWGLIFIGTIVTVGVWSDLKDIVIPRQSVSLEDQQIRTPRREDGHFYLTLTVDGTPVEFIVDTGATDIVLSAQDAQNVGIDFADLNFTGRASTANGVVRTARVQLENVRIGDLREGRLTAHVNEGELETSLLGMAYLERFQRIEMKRDTLILER